MSYRRDDKVHDRDPVFDGEPSIQRREPPAPLYCPFCGKGDCYVYQHPKAFNVNCDGCCAAGPAADTEEEAVTLWNTRAPTAAKEPQRPIVIFTGE